MLTSYNQFSTNFRYIEDLDALYLFLTGNLKLSNDLTDLLRAEIVYAVSALDTLIHNLVKVGMVQSFYGTRLKTKKFKVFPISSENLINIQTATINNLHSPSIPLPEYWFEQEIVLKHRLLAFQDPDKIAEGLSLIWDEQYKWDKIAISMSLPVLNVKTTLKNIVARRNQIVHESDIDLLTNLKNNIDYNDVKISTEFIKLLGKSIYENVI